MTVDDAILEYEKLGGQVFGYPRWWSVRGPLYALRDKYNHERLERCIKTVVHQRNPSTSSDNQNHVHFESDKDLCKT